MRQKLLDWILWRVYGYDPKVQRFLVRVAKENGLQKKDYPTVIDHMTDGELSDFLFILRGCPEPDENWGGMDIFYKETISKDERAKKLLEMVKDKIEERRKQTKKQKFFSLDWDNLELNESSFKLSYEKNEMGVIGQCRIDISPNQIDGFPTHVLTYSLSVCLGEEEVLLGNGKHSGIVNVYTNAEETKWLEKHRAIVSFNPYATTPPKPLFKDDYYQQKNDVFQPLPENTKQRIKAFLCGPEDEDPEKSQFENPELIKPILRVLVYNNLLRRKLELDKAHIKEEIKSKHLKEKMYYRLVNQYSLNKEKREKLKSLYLKRKTSK